MSLSPCHPDRGQAIFRSKASGRTPSVPSHGNDIREFLREFGIRRITCPSGPARFSSITCNGQSGQLFVQHTMMSHCLGSCPCVRKLRLSNSNSIRTRCHRSWSPCASLRSQETRSAAGHPEAQLCGNRPKQVHHAISLIGAWARPGNRSGAPYIGRSSSISPIVSTRFRHVREWTRSRTRDRTHSGYCDRFGLRLEA